MKIPYSPAAVSRRYQDRQIWPLAQFLRREGRQSLWQQSQKTCRRQCIIHRFEDGGDYVYTVLTRFILRQFAVMTMLTVSAAVFAQRTDSIAHNGVLEGVTVTDKARSGGTAATTPVRLLDSRDMLRLGVADMADALRRLPGITLRDYGGAGGMKTVAVRGLGAQHTGVSYDGVALSDCQTGEIDVSRYSLENAESIALTISDNEDIFVPARNAAFASMLSVNTVQPPSGDLRPHVTAQVKFGSFGYVSPFVRYSHNFTDRMAFTMSGEYVYAENDYPFTLRNGGTTMREKRTNSRMNSVHAETGFIWKTGTNGRLDGKIYYYDNNRRLPGQVRYYTDMSGERLHESNFFAQAQYRVWNSRNLSAKFTAKYNWASSIYTDATYKDGANDASYWQREAYVSACLLYTPAKAWALDYSADYIFNNLNSSLDTDTRPRRHAILQTAAARYKSGRLTVMARLLWSMYFNAAKAGSAARNVRRLSPSASMSFRLLEDEELYVRLSYKNIFRAPTFNESYYFHYGSTSLLPESTDQVNLGMACRHVYGKSSHFRLSADGYINRVKDKIVAVPYNMFIWTNINVGKVCGHGIEAEATIEHHFSPRFTLLGTANYGWQRAENRTSKSSQYYGYQLAYTPEHQGSATVSFENPWVNVSIHGYAVSKRHANNNHYEGTDLPGYAEFGLTAYRQWRIWQGTLETRADIKNLFDKQYEIVARYPMPGRSWQFSINYKF